ncbi:hypothetical protein J5Z11_004725, partial [Escherichia coli]|nr:hypothetical protein [Escherichia coli]HBD0218448.1 DUF5445 family protein [Escherichia coli]
LSVSWSHYLNINTNKNIRQVC